MPPPPSAWEIGFIAMRDDLCSQTRVLHPLYKGLPQGFSSQSAWVKGGWRLDTKKPALVAGHLKESTQTGIKFARSLSTDVHASSSVGMGDWFHRDAR